jgi:tetratricopeptide (TPR) repeat protein
LAPNDFFKWFLMDPLTAGAKPYWYGCELYASKNYEQALSCFVEAGKLNQQRADTYVMLGLTCRELGTLNDKAEECFRKATALESGTFWDAHLLLGTF